jgi:hypothetical protein
LTVSLPPVARLPLLSRDQVAGVVDAYRESVPSPPSIVSAPVCPAVQLSDPAPPSSTLLPVLPVRLSLKPLPIRFSMLISVSEPEPPVACAPAVARLTVTPERGKGVGDGVVAGCAIDDVVAVTGVKRVVERVAGAVARAGEHQAQAFDVGGQGVGREVAVDDVVAAGGEAAVAFADQIAGVVDGIGVGAVAAEHRVGARGSVQKIRPGAAVETLLPALPVRLSLKPLPIRFSMLISVSLPEPPVACAPAVARLTVTPARGKGVGDGVVAGGAVDDIVAVTGVKQCCRGVAGAVARAGEHQAQAFDVGGQGVGREVAVDDIVAAGGEAAVAFADQVAGVVDA